MMTDRAIIVIAICALLAVCIICATFLRWKRRENERAQDYNKTCENIIERLIKGNDDYSITMGDLSSERIAGKKKITIKGEDKKEHKVIEKVIEWVCNHLKKES